MSAKSPNQIFEEQLLELGEGDFDRLAEITRAVEQPHMLLGASKSPMQLLFDHWEEIEANLGDEEFLLAGEDPEEEGYWSLNSLVMGHFVGRTGPSMEDSDGVMVDWLGPYMDKFGTSSEYFDSMGSQPAVGRAFFEFYEDRQLDSHLMLHIRNWIKSDSDLPNLKSFLDSCETDAHYVYSSGSSKSQNINGWVSLCKFFNFPDFQNRLIDRLENQGLDLNAEFHTQILNDYRVQSIQCNVLGYALVQGSEGVVMHLASKGLFLDSGLINGQKTDSLNDAMTAAGLLYEGVHDVVESKLRALENAVKAQVILSELKTELGIKP